MTLTFEPCAEQPDLALVALAAELHEPWWRRRSRRAIATDLFRVARDVKRMRKTLDELVDDERESAAAIELAVRERKLVKVW